MLVESRIKYIVFTLITQESETIEPQKVCMVHMVSFSLAFYIVLRPQGVRIQMKTLRKQHRVHIALFFRLSDP